MEMTAKKLKELCRKDSLYSTPYLNEKLYLHYKGFRRVECLEEYTGLKVLWLEGNGLGAIQGLEAQRGLRTLYLQENLIERVEGLAHMRELVTLNLCKNLLRELPLAALAALPALQTLMVAHNHLPSAAACEGLRACAALTTLDLQENRIEDPEIVDVLADLPQLAVLYLQGNPCVKRIRHYRKHVVGRLRGLKYLDDRPVFDDERKRCDVWYAAWVAGAPAGAAAGGGAGYDDAAAMAAERAEMERQRAEKLATEERNFNAFADFVRRSAEERARAPPAPGEAPFELEAQDESNLPEAAEGEGEEEGGEGEDEEAEEDPAAGSGAMSAAIRAFSQPRNAAVAPPVLPPAAAQRRSASAGASNAAASAGGAGILAAEGVGANASAAAAVSAAAPMPASALVPPPPPPLPIGPPRPSPAEAYAQAADPAGAVNPFSGEPIAATTESPEARAYREERWQRILEASENFRGGAGGGSAAPPPPPVSVSASMPVPPAAVAAEVGIVPAPLEAPAGEPEAANAEERELCAAERAAADDSVRGASPAAAEAPAPTQAFSAAPAAAEAAAAAAAAPASTLAERLAQARERAAALAPPPSAPSAAAREAGDFLRLLRAEVAEGSAAAGVVSAEANLAPAEHSWEVVEGAEEAAASVAASAATVEAAAAATSEPPPAAHAVAPRAVAETDLEDVD